MKFAVFASATLTLVSPLLSSARPMRRQTSSSSNFTLQNGIDAINLNNEYATLTTSSPCTTGEVACINSEFAQCANGAYVLTSCGTGLVCAALPLVNSAGTSTTCTTEADLESRIAATGATNTTAGVSAIASGTSIAAVASSTGISTSSGTTVSVASATTASSVFPSVSVSVPAASSTSSSQTSNATAAQTSLCLDPSVISTGISQDGLGLNTTETGEVASLTSTNNFINFCATVPGLAITNGTQNKNGSCNPVPMGSIPSTNNMPSAKFISPTNFGTVVGVNQTFQVTLGIQGMQTGSFVNADTNYFGAPQQLNSTSGQIIGHTHIVIEALTALNQTTLTNPNKFAFFLGLNSPANAEGQLFANVTGGLPAGAYRISTINTAMNHQPVLLPVAQHGGTDDQIYFTVVESDTTTSAGVTSATA